MIDLARFDAGESGRTRLFDAPKTVRLALTAGETIPPHDHPGTAIVLAVIEGTLELRVDDDSATLEGGEVARFDGDHSIALSAATDVTALLVLATD